jgi:hypothetical protein
MQTLNLKIFFISFPHVDFSSTLKSFACKVWEKIDRKQPGDIDPTNKNPNSLQKFEKKHERKTKRDLYISSDRSKVGFVLPSKNESFVFLYLTD